MELLTSELNDNTVDKIFDYVRLHLKKSEPTNQETKLVIDLIFKMFNDEAFKEDILNDEDIDVKAQIEEYNKIMYHLRFINENYDNENLEVKIKESCTFIFDFFKQRFNDMDELNQSMETFSDQLVNTCKELEEKLKLKEIANDILKNNDHKILKDNMLWISNRLNKFSNEDIIIVKNNKYLGYPIKYDEVLKNNSLDKELMIKYQVYLDIENTLSLYECLTKKLVNNNEPQ